MVNSSNRFILLWTLIALSILLNGCDPLHLNRCEWYLDPEPKHRDLVEPGWVSICARNFEINREKCYLKMPLDMAKKVFNKPFKFKDLKLRDDVMPREITSVTLCRNTN